MATEPKKIVTLLMSLSMVAVMTTGCAKVVERRGYIADSQALSEIEVGMDNEESVRQILGTPSTEAPFVIDGRKAWYYISTTTERRAFFQPVAVERSVLAVYFDENQKLTDMRRYGLEDGQVVDIVSRKTPTRGKELSLLGQLFGNIGRFNNSGPGGPGGQSGPRAPGGDRGGSIPR